MCIRTWHPKVISLSHSFQSIFLPRRASSAKCSSKKKECVFVGKKEAVAQFAGINNLWSKLTDEQENANGLRKYRVSNERS